MSLKALLFVGVYFSGLGLAFFQPLAGLLVYLWTFYEYPEQRWWGQDLPDLRWSLTASVITFAAVAIHRSMGTPQGDQDKSEVDGQSIMSFGLVMLVGFTAWMWIQSLWAVDPVSHEFGCMLFTKYTIFFALLQILLRERRGIDTFMLANVAGCLLWGVMMWQQDRGEARLEMQLGPGVEDANTLALHLGVFVFVAGTYLLGYTTKWRWLLAGAIPFILNGIVLTGSRGGIVALLVGGITVLVLMPTQRKGTIIVCAVLGLILMARLTRSETFWGRMVTINQGIGGDSFADPEEMEASAASRFVIAAGDWAMFQDYPMGVGHRGDIVLSPRYMPAWVLDPIVGVRAAHNTWLAVLTNHGIPGTLLFLGLHLWGALVLLRLRGLDKEGLPSHLGAYRAAIGAGLTMYFISGMFSNYIKAEVGIWCFALIPALQRECLAWKARTKTAEGESVEPAAKSGRFLPPIVPGFRPSPARFRSHV